MEARVISCTTFGGDKVVKIVVPNQRAIAKYKAGENETTIVVSDDTCSEKDIEEIKKLCEKLGYAYEGRLDQEILSRTWFGLTNLRITMIFLCVSLLFCICFLCPIICCYE